MAEQHEPGSAAPDPSPATAEAGRSYLPAMGHDWLLPLYDPLTRALGMPAAHRRLTDQADLRPGHRVLEIGCGTGNLLLLIKRRHPDTVVVGLDPDAKVLARVRRKSDRAGLPVQLDRGFSDALPYPDASLDRVLSAFMLHHLQPTDRRSTMREIRRVLAPGGSVHLVDFDAAEHRSHGLPFRRTRKAHQRGHDAEPIPTLMQGAGLTDPVQTGHHHVKLLGRYTFYRAHR